VSCVPEHAPPHESKYEVLDGTAVSVTTVFSKYDAEQPDPQLICDDCVGFEVEVTEPEPAPAFVTDRRYDGGLNVTVRVVAPFTVTAHEVFQTWLVRHEFWDHPPITLVPSGDAETVTVVPYG
jgi:hypothetical protein